MQILRFLALLLPFAAGSAGAWNADGHRTIGALAAHLIKGSRAEREVQALLGEVSLADAAIWADCAKSIEPAREYQYQHRGRYPDCRLFETPAEEAAMGAFVRRNDSNCRRGPGDAICHRQYHYADVPLRQPRYRLGLATSRDDDIVAAIAASAQVLKGEPPRAPFDIGSAREALLLLAHYVGDLHQPLHVGAIYLSAAGRPVDPDADGFDPLSDTHGGNSLLVAGKKLHAIWDEIPESLGPDRLDSESVRRAQRVARTRGAVADWPALWASDTLREARRAYHGLGFEPRHGSEWSVRLPADYATRLQVMQARQLTQGGAHLAQLLTALWPEPP